MMEEIIKAIELAIAHEFEARKAYLALAGEKDDAELKSLLREIAAEEAGHEATLRSRLRRCYIFILRGDPEGVIGR